MRVQRTLFVTAAQGFAIDRYPLQGMGIRREHLREGICQPAIDLGDKRFHRDERQDPIERGFPWTIRVTKS